MNMAGTASLKKVQHQIMNRWSFSLNADMLKQDGMLHYWEGWLLKMEKKAEALKPRLTLPLYYQWNMVTALDVVVKT